MKIKSLKDLIAILSTIYELVARGISVNDFLLDKLW
jgi:hypothetical protein